jgi:hypothetical protein
MNLHTKLFLLALMSATSAANLAAAEAQPNANQRILIEANVKPKAVDDKVSAQPEKAEHAELVEEYRRNGQVYQTKITPSIGAPYFIDAENNRDQFKKTEAYENSKPAMWSLKQF